jgi:hypothetical protein
MRYKFQYDYDKNANAALCALLNDGWFIESVTTEDGYKWLMIVKCSA